MGGHARYFIAANDANLFDAIQHKNILNYSTQANDRHMQMPLCLANNGNHSPYLFHQLINLMMAKEQQRLTTNEITKQTFEMLRSRLCGHLLRYFGDQAIREINHRKISEFITYLQSQQIGAVTIKQYLSLLKRVLQAGVLEEWMDQLPIFPNIKSKSIPRGSFSVSEYWKLLKIAKQLSCIEEAVKPITHRNTANGAFIKSASVPKEMTWLIGFMVNTFIRPVDIKLIKNKHIQIIDGSSRYLRISMIETKKHTGQIVSMRVAVNIYKKILAFQQSKGYGSPEDYVFLPQVSDRQGAIALVSGHFKKILDAGNLATGVNNEKRTLYSLRHTAITFRLLFGRGIDLLTLARNARTSVEMIERFYSSNLTAEMNIELLQSKRTTSEPRLHA